MTGIIMSAYVGISSPQGYLLPPQDAPRYVAKALYQEFEMDAIASRIEKKYIKLDDRPELVYLGIVIRVVSEKRISWHWRF